MRSSLFSRSTFKIFVLSTFLLSVSTWSAAQKKVYDFVLLTGPTSPGTTLIGSSITINGGSVGAYKLVQTTGNVTINANIYSADKIILSNSNIVKGDISAAANYPNSPLSTGTILSVGSSASITGNIDVYGNVVIGGGTVSGRVTLPSTNNTYSGPNPSLNVFYGTPTLQTLPTLPQPFNISNTYPVINNTTTTGNLTVGPGNHGNINYSGNKTLKLLKPGVYVFTSIKMTGNSNSLIFDFANTAGNYQIYIRNNADFGKLNASIAGGGDASRIYLEAQGTGVGASIAGNSFIIANGSSGGGSKWMGTAYATAAAINIGSGTGSSSLAGAFWSNKAITLQSGVTVTYSAFNPCTPPDVIAGIGTNPFVPIDTIPLDFTGHTTLTAKSNTAGTSFVWQASKGGIITSPNANNATIEVEAAGTYIVSAYTDDANCVSKDSIVVAAKMNNLIGGQLLSIYQNYDPINPDPELDSFFVTDNGYVTIDIFCKVDTTTVINLLIQPQYGLINRLPNGLSPHTVTGDFPIINLLKLNLLPHLLVACKPYNNPGVQGGLVISQGDSTMRSFLVRKGYNLSGSGIKIGVISDSYNTILDPSTTFSDPCSGINQTLIVNTAAVDVSNGDLANVTVVQDFPIKRTDEGRAMMQIVQDVAPGTQKFFHTGVFTAGHLAQAIEYLAFVKGVQVSVDDVSFLDQPMLKDGVIGKSINKVRLEKNVFHCTAAGNFGRQSYSKNFNGVDAASIGFPGKKAHNFGNNNASPDFFQKVMLRPGAHVMVFQWLDNNFSQGEPGALYDLDFYLTPGNKTDGTGLIGYNTNNVGYDAVEFIHILIPGNGPCDTVARPYNILIVNNSTSPFNNVIKYIGFRGGMRVAEYDEGNSTIAGHGLAEGAFTVGAARFNHVPGHPLLPSSLSNITKPQIETFSSVGGTLGRQKPELAGPDGVDVTVMLGQDYPGAALNSFPNFFGTSAAAPHVAAAAALIIQARLKYLNQPTSPDQLKTLLQSTAVDMRPTGLVGYDFSSGAGLIDVDAAIRTFAAPAPFQISLVKPTNVIPCQDPFVLTITGENFSSNTKVYLVEGPGDSTILTPHYISPQRDTLKVTISSCVGNPQILAFTPATPRVPPVVGGAIDGGFSNSIKLFSKEIIIQTQNVSRKYGQANPVPSTTITIDGVPIEQTNLTRAAVGLDATKLASIETIAATYSDVGTYAIKVYRTFSTSNPTDVALANQYRYIFKSGLITIGKMPITVTPNDITATYGNYIGEITFKYEFTQDLPANTAALRDTAKKYHEAFLPKNALALIKDFRKQQANGSILTNADLANLSTMVSFNALSHSRKFKIVNNKLVPETDPNALNSQYIVDVASESFYEFKLDPTLAKFYTAYPGINKKAVLGEVPLDNYEAEVQVTNGGISSLKPLILGYPTLVLNGTGISRLAPMINGELISMLDGKLATLNSSTGQFEPIANSPNVQYLNGSGRLMYLINGAVTYVPDNSYVVIPNLAVTLKVVNVNLNGTRLNYLINGVEYPVISTSDVSADVNGVLVNRLSLQPLINGSVLTLGSRLGLATLINGTGISRLSPLINGTGISRLSPLINDLGISVTNGGISRLMPIINNEPGPGGTSTNNTGVIFDETDVDDASSNYLGALFGINTITGLDVGVQTLVPGKLMNTNFAPIYVTGKATIQSDACLITHGPFTNFGNTATSPTSLWLNMTTKVSGQLTQIGDYLLFKGGSVTFNFVTSTPTVTDLDIPNGKIVADNVSAPVTSFDSVNNLWTTKVPVGFASTSDIFITGAKINSSTGFVKMNGNTNSVVKGRFYSNKTFSDQWAYAIAAYRPQFFYAAIDDPGAIASVNGTYKAGAPIPLIPYLVQGASGGGGNNYSGSKSAYDNYTACPESANTQVAGRPIVNAITETTNAKLAGIVQIYPNPATNHIMVSFVPEQSGNSRIMLYTIDGRKVLEVNNGSADSGKLYLRSMDVSKLTKGVYMIQLWSGNKVTIKKIIID